MAFLFNVTHQSLASDAAYCNIENQSVLSHEVSWKRKLSILRYIKHFWLFCVRFFACDKFHNYIYGRTVNIITDHKPLYSKHNEKYAQDKLTPIAKNYNSFRIYTYILELDCPIIYLDIVNEAL